jgi:hypothetical protein
LVCYSFYFKISIFCFLLVQIEPDKDIAFSVISSSTRVTVIPEFREQSPIQPTQVPSLPSDNPTETPTSLKLFVRSIGTFVCSSLPNSPLSIFNETGKKSIHEQTNSKLALVPGRHRRLFRVEIDETTSVNPTIALINRSDWSSIDDDGTGWPSIFAVKVTVYRSSKEVTKLFRILLNEIFFRLNQ